MRSNRSLLVAVVTASALLALPIALQAKPRAIQQTRNGQRVVNNIVLQLQAKKLIQKRKKHHTVTGTVLAIHKNKQVPGTGTIKLQVANHHRKHKNQVAAKANGNAVQVAAVKNAKCQRRAAALGQQRKRKTHTVTLAYVRGTKFAVTVKGLFDHLVTRTVGSGKNKAKVVLNQPKVQTKNLPSHVRHVQKGQTLKVMLHDPHHLNKAKEVHILTPSVTGKAK
jgi:hypothetical protein